MRLSIVLNLLCTVAFSANSFSQSQSFSMNLENAKVRDVFRSIEGQSTYRFFYNDELTDINRVVSMNVKDMNIEEVLNQLFTNSDISYTILENNLVVIAPKRAIQQQKISGVVTDASTGETLAGVSVLVEGTTTGAITDVNGKFTVEAPQNAVLIFSFMGYTPERITASGQTIDVKLIPDVKKLDEVVVVGYGTMKKLDVSGAIVSTNASVIKEVPSISSSSALQGRLPGIDIAQTSTRPGADMQIRIRGDRSINADNNPLIVVDGIPFTGGSLNDISPSDIKSIDILKDASSTAIYGSRGANGVILVTTIRGANNSEPTITYNGYVGIKTVAKKYEMFNGPEFMAFRRATLNTQYTNKYTTLEAADTTAHKYYDWQDLMYQNAIVTNHDFSVSSGTKKGAYSFGGGYYDETAVLPGQKYQRYSLRAAVDQEIGKFIKIGLSSQNAYAITDGESASLMNNILTMSPYAPPYNTDGSVRINPTEGWVDTYYNPLLLKNSDLWQETRKRFSTYNALYGEIKFTKDLRYRLNVGLNLYQENYGNYYGSNTPFQNGSVSSATVQNKNNFVWTIENLLYYDKVIAEKHRINFTAMFSSEQSQFNQSQMSGTALPADFLYYYNLGLANGDKTIASTDASGNTKYQNYNQRGLISYMGRLQYAYDNRYTLTATFRADGASVLASGHKWHNYPAFSAGWNVNNESFLRDIKAISQLKLRFGYGQTSNQAITPYSTLGALSQAPYNFGTTNQYGFYVTSLPNPNLGWEFTENYNMGLDWGLFNGRITGYVDIYQQKTKDLLLSVTLPYSSGVSGSFMKNIGSTENKGIEASISVQVIKPNEKGGFGFDVDFNIYANRNKVTGLNSGQSQDVNAGLFVGHPMNVIYDYKKIGIVQQSEAPYFGYTAGHIKVADLNKDGKITADGDRKIIGSFDPDCAGGFTTRFSFKNFDLSAVFFYKSGGLLVSTIHQPQSYLNTNDGRRNSIKLDYWTPTHTTGEYPQPGNQGSAELNDYGSTLGYFSASFLKARTITLGYTFDPKLLRVVGCKDARIYITCQNPFTLFSPYMKHGGLDPEATGTGSQSASTGIVTNLQTRQLTIGANTPPTRNFLVGLSVKF